MFSFLFAALLCVHVPEVTSDLHRDWFPTCINVATRAHEEDLPPAVLLSIAWHESRFNLNAVGRAGEQGPLQAMPRWGRDSGSDTVAWGINAAKHYLGRYGVEEGLCRYKGASHPCASSGRRLGWASALEAAAR